MTIREIAGMIEKRGRIPVKTIAVMQVLARMADEGQIQRIEVQPFTADRQVWYRRLDEDSAGAEVERPERKRNQSRLTL